MWAATAAGACSLGSSGQPAPDGAAGGAVGAGGVDAAGPAVWSVESLPAHGRSLALHGVGGDLYVAGDNGMVLRTGDGALTWADVTIAPAATGSTLTSYPVFQAIGASAVDDVWAAGAATPASGVLMHTADRGQTWQRVDVGAASPLFGIWAIDREHVVAATAGGRILVTADGGASWTTAFSDPSMVLWGAWGSNGGGELYVVGGVTVVGDGGVSGDVPDGGDAPDGGVAADGGADVTIPTYVGVVLRSTDGGATWQKVAGTTTACLLWRVSGTADGATVYAVGDCGSIASTTDHGATWTLSGAVSAGGNYGISDVWVSPIGTAYLVQDGRGWNLTGADQHVCHDIEVGDNGVLIASSTGCEVLPPTSGGFSSSPLAIWGTTDDDVWVVGAYTPLWHRP
jgi:photosystem II stability/assembly factor-like uncharacterized protein